ncbi:hypothetical protein [Thalassobellus sediminis]|uniref:hypothetical protein n=1 Tax=Thalassobellus sediminis TaxID=3367753 RepID=UPI00379BCD6F
MKLLLTFLFLLNFGISNSQNFIKSVIYCAKVRADEKLRFAVGKEILDNHFQFDESKTLIEIYNEEEDIVEKFNFSDLKKTECQITQFWLYYKVSDENLVLTELFFPFNPNCTTPWATKRPKEIIEPYLKVLQNKTEIKLKEALKIGKNNGLSKIYYWDIAYEKRKLVWTLKSELEKKQSKVIKINSKNGKILSEFIEIPID